MLAHTSAATAAASRIAALPLCVRRKSRSGASRLRAQAVRPDSRPVCVSPAVEVSSGTSAALT